MQTELAPANTYGLGEGELTEFGAGLTRRQALGGLCMAPWLVISAGAEGATPSLQERVQLAVSWPEKKSPQGFWVSEKLDGVRAVWDGRILRFRSGRVISAPAWFLSALPAVPLDGELWIGRSQFDRLSGLVRQVVPNDQAWKTVTYRVFDAPNHAGSFSERIRFVEAKLSAVKPDWLIPVRHETVNNPADLQVRLQSVVAQGGEGLMLHRADAHWQTGRTGALFKLKRELDEEGLVVGYLSGKGRLHGMTGALLVQMPSGQRFALGTGLSDLQRRNPPSLGAWVTYRYRERTPSGLPRFASFLRVREVE